MAQSYGPDVPALRVFKRKVLCKIFGQVRVADDFRLRYNSELYELFNDMNVVQCINIQRLRWLAQIVSKEGYATARWVFDAGIYGSRPNRGSPVIDWCYQLA